MNASRQTRPSGLKVEIAAPASGGLGNCGLEPTGECAHPRRKRHHRYADSNYRACKLDCYYGLHFTQGFFPLMFQRNFIGFRWFLNNGSQLLVEVKVGGAFQLISRAP
jgi:hypothetical protein